MKHLNRVLVAATFAAAPFIAGNASAQDTKTLILGVSAPMSGAAATWGWGRNGPPSRRPRRSTTQEE